MLSCLKTPAPAVEILFVFGVSLPSPPRHQSARSKGSLSRPPPALENTPCSHVYPPFLLYSFRLAHDDDARARSEKAYVILSKFKDERSLQIGILPWGPPGGDRENGPRGGNLITLPEHPLWNFKTGEEASFVSPRACGPCLRSVLS